MWARPAGQECSRQSTSTLLSHQADGTASDVTRPSALSSSAEILAGAAKSVSCSSQRRLSAVGLAPTSGEVVSS